MAAYVLDCETTGFTPPVEPVAIAIGRSTLFDVGRSIRNVDSLAEAKTTWYRPTKPIECGAMATHKIIFEDLTEYEPFSCFALPDDCEFLIGHNVDFDWKLIGAPHVKRICTFALARSIWPDADSHSLAALQFLLRSSHGAARAAIADAHSAICDIYNSAYVLSRCRDVLGVDDWHALWLASERARIPTVMPFGKHKGTRINDMPRDYVRWLLAQEIDDPYLRKALEAAPMPKKGRAT